MISYVRWFGAIDCPQYIPRKGGQILRQNVINSRRTTLFRLHRECSSPNWFILVRMDFFPFDPLDRSHLWHRLCHYGRLLYLSCRLQLSCGYLSSLRKLGIGSPIFLSEHSRRDLSTHDDSDVQSHDIRWGFELPWCYRGTAHHRALGISRLWT